MADEVDVSQVESDFLLSLRLSQRTQYQGQSEKACIECGDNIPLSRRITLPGVQYCVGCVERHECSQSR